MSYTKEQQIKYQNKFVAEKYDRFTATFPKGKKEEYRKHAESKGMSLNSYINELIKKDMEA
jgi:predicted HicB family RNase H-like nuclease